MRDKKQSISAYDNDLIFKSLNFSLIGSKDRSSDEYNDANNETREVVDLSSQNKTVGQSDTTYKPILSETDILATKYDPLIESTYLEKRSTEDCNSQHREREENSPSDISSNERTGLTSNHSDSKSELLKLKSDCNNPSTSSDKPSLLGRASATTTTNSSSEVSEEDLVEKSALADDVELNSLQIEKRRSVPEELKTIKHSCLIVEQSEKIFVASGNQSEPEDEVSIIFEGNFNESPGDRPKSENVLIEEHSNGDNSRGKSSEDGAQKHHSESQTNRGSMIRDLGRYNSSKSTPSLNRKSLNQNQQSSNSSQVEDQSSSYATAPLAPFKSSSSSYVEFPSASASLYETALSNLTKTSNIEQNLGDSNCTITDYNNDITNTASEMANFSAEDKQEEVTISSEQYLSPLNVGSPTITPNGEDVGGLTADEEEAIANQTLDLESSPTPGPSRAVNSNDIASDSKTRQIQQIEIEDSNIKRESIEEGQINRALTAKRLSEGNNRLNTNFARKNSLHMVGDLPPLTEGEPIKYTSSPASQNIDSATSSTSSGSLRQSKHLREVSKRGSQDGSVSCSSSTSLERSPTRRRGSTVSQCSSVLSEDARNQLNFDSSPDLPLETSLLEANSVSSTDLCRPISPEPPLMNSDRFDPRPESRLSDEDIICSLSHDVTLECSIEKRNSTEAEVEESNPIHGPVFEHKEKIEHETQADKELDPTLDETDSIIFDDSLNRPGTSSASSFCNDTIIENLPSSTRELSTNQGRKSVSSTSKIPRASSKSPRCSSVNENRRNSDDRVVSSRTPEARNTRSTCFSNRSRTLNSPSNNSNNDIDKLRSANSTCSSSSSSHSSSKGSPRPRSRGHEGNGKS